MKKRCSASLNLICSVACIHQPTQSLKEAIIDGLLGVRFSPFERQHSYLMRQHINSVMGLPQINGLDDFGLLFDTGAFVLGVDCQVSYIHVERNRKQSFIISDKCGIVHVPSGLALMSVLIHPKKKKKTTRTVQAHFDDPGIYTFLISPRLSFGKSLADKGVELQRHYFFVFQCDIT